MTHAQAIERLLAAASGGGLGDATARDELARHVARCSDCWAALAADVAAATGEAPEVEPRFGCEAVQDELFALVDLDPAAVAREHRDAARHLAWCLACRTRLAEIVAVERDLAAGPRWLDLGGRVREAVGRLVVRVGRAAAGLVEIPEAFVPGPALAPVPVRAATPADVVVALPRAARFALGDSGAIADVALEEAGGGACAIAVRVTAPTGAGPFSLRLREAGPARDALLARHTLHADEPVVVRGLWPGAFAIELHDARDGTVHRVHLDVTAG